MEEDGNIPLADGMEKVNNSNNETVKPSAEEMEEFRCEHCGNVFHKKSKYLRHVRTHTKEKPFQCTFTGCGKVFSRKDHLTRHMASHNETYDFPCYYEGCNKKFKSEYNLRRHYRKHLLKENNPPPTYKCSYCGEEFSKKQQLRKHEYFHTGVKPFPCQFPGCNRSFLSLSRLVIHEKTHKEANCICCVPGCSFVTSNIEEFRNHMKTVHAPPTPPEPPLSPRVPCKIPGCSRTFTSKKTMMAHVNTFHNHVKYQCEFCNKVYAQLPSLSRHRKQKHKHEAEARKKRILISLGGRSEYYFVEGGDTSAPISSLLKSPTENRSSEEREKSVNQEKKEDNHSDEVNNKPANESSIMKLPLKPSNLQNSTSSTNIETLFVPTGIYKGSDEEKLYLSEDSEEEDLQDSELYYDSSE